MSLSKSLTISKHLLKIGAVSLSPQKPFTWASGIQSPVYCDNRLILSYPKVRNDVVNEFINIIRKNKIKFDSIAGIATGGIPTGAILADRLKKPFIYVRSQPKAHGKGNQVEGRLKKNERVLVIEDLVSTGMSSLGAIHALRNSGAKVSHCLAVFTYGFPKSRDAFQESKCQLMTLANLETLLQVAVRQKKISASEEALIREFSLNPKP